MLKLVVLLFLITTIVFGKQVGSGRLLQYYGSDDNGPSLADLHQAYSDVSRVKTGYGVATGEVGVGEAVTDLTAEEAVDLMAEAALLA
eukprot:UN13564